MGCASSGPVPNSGKNFIDAAKDTANDVATKGEKTIHDVTETAKEGINTGIETVKEAVETAVNTAENSIGSVVSKIGETFHTTTNAAKENVEKTIDTTRGAAESAYDQTSSSVRETFKNFETAAAETSNKVAEDVGEAERAVLKKMRHVEETASETQTSMASKIDEMKEAVSTKTFGQLQNEVNESFNQTKESLKEALHIEDLDHDFDVLDEKVKEFERKTEDLVDGLPSPVRGRIPTPAPMPPPAIQEEKKEEPPPTFWEAAADAILLRRLRPFRNPMESDLETEVGSERDEADTDHEHFDKHQQQHKLEERFVNVPRLMENGNDIVSLKSYKSSDTIIDD